MLRALLVLSVLGVVIYTVSDIATTPKHRVQYLPKPVWILLSLSLFGAIAWYFYGRPPADPGPQRGYVGTAPDDDPTFLWRLQQENRKTKGRDPEDPDPDGADENS